MSQRIENELAALRAENARLVALLETHGVAWKPASVATPIAASPMLVDEKLALFRRLFAGRTDTYALRWENKSGKSGYAPACANEWRAGVCEKPRIKCSDCLHRSLLPLTDQVVSEHLRGRVTVGAIARWRGKRDRATGSELHRICTCVWGTRKRVRATCKRDRRIRNDERAICNHGRTKRKLDRAG